MNHALIFSVKTRMEGPRFAGQYRIAHLLRENGWDCEVIDFTGRWSLINLKYLAMTRLTPKTKFIGFGHLFSYWSPLLEEFCLWVKQKYPWVVVLSGSSVLPSFESKAIDYFIQGFGEHATLILLKYLFSNGERPIFKDFHGKKVIEANTHYPAYPMNSLMIKYEDRDLLQPEEWLAIETARGCKFECDFCNFPVLGVKGDYSRDAEDFREHLVEAYDRFGITRYVISDETFNDRTEKVTKFADVVDTLNFKPEFVAYIRADLLISRPMDRVELARMNVSGQYYGIESFNKLAARAVSKGMSSPKVKQGLIDVRKYFEENLHSEYQGCISLICGLPGEDLASLEETKQWMIANWKGQAYSSFFLNIPKSDAMKPSKISSQYEKYGYVEMTAEEVARRSKETGIPVIYGHEAVYGWGDFEKLYYGQEMMWKNDQMDIFDAFGKFDEFKEMLHSGDFKYDPFDNGHDVIQALKVDGMDFPDYYVQKKLNM